MTNKTAHCVRPESLPWISVGRDVEMKVLRVSEESGFWTAMIRFKPGGVLPRHKHLGAAELYIIKGSGNHPQSGEFCSGDYIYEKNGAVHEEVTSNEEILLFMTNYGPTAFLNSDDSVQFILDVDYLMQFSPRSE